MVADAEKKAKLTEQAPEDDAYHLDKEFVLSVEKLQEVQDALDKLMSHPVLCDILSEEDQKIFKYLNSIDVVDFKDDKMLGYSVTFSFNGNPYFEDTKLTKTFTFIDGETNKNYRYSHQMEGGHGSCKWSYRREKWKETTTC
ncbi:unnamed protein product [Malus baccata var. baccata]